MRIRYEASGKDGLDRLTMPVVLISNLMLALVMGWSEISRAEQSAGGMSQAAGASSPLTVGALVGRYQLIVVPGHAASPFLLDTMTGCLWQQGQSQETKRTVFLEVDVENLHWSWGSGTQQILSSRVDHSSFTDDQKRAWKESLQRTSCGSTNVVLTPGQFSSPTPEKGTPPIPAP